MLTNTIRTGSLVLALLSPAATAAEEPIQLGACEQVAAHVEAFREAMVKADADTLIRLADDNLSFGHSNGLIQTREEFVDTVAYGQEIFLSVELSERSCKESIGVAMERHIFDAEILIMGEPLSVRLNVLEVWRQEGADWRLVARQAFST